jgi:hypothetical protein
MTVSVWSHRDLQIIRYVANGLTYARLARHYKISSVRVSQIVYRFIRYAMRPPSVLGEVCWQRRPVAWLRCHRDEVCQEVNRITARLFEVTP